MVWLLLLGACILALLWSWPDEDSIGKAEEVTLCFADNVELVESSLRSLATRAYWSGIAITVTVYTSNEEIKRIAHMMGSTSCLNVIVESLPDGRCSNGENSGPGGADSVPQSRHKVHGFKTEDLDSTGHRRW